MKFSFGSYIRVSVLFKKELDGSTKWRALYPPMFGAFIKVGEHLYECRLFFEDEGIVYPGTERTFKVMFLQAKKVIPKFVVGGHFQLKTLEILGEGTVLEIVRGGEGESN